MFFPFSPRIWRISLTPSADQWTKQISYPPVEEIRSDIDYNSRTSNVSIAQMPSETYIGHRNDLNFEPQVWLLPKFVGVKYPGALFDMQTGIQ